MSSNNFGINSIIAQLGQIFKTGVPFQGASGQGGFPQTPLGNAQSLINKAGGNILGGDAAGILGSMLTPGSSVQTKPLAKSSIPMTQLLQQEGLFLNAQQTAQFLREAVNFPKEIQLLLLMLTSESPDKALQAKLKQNLKSILEQNPEGWLISTNDVASLIEGNAKDAASKLVKMLQNNTALQLKTGQQVMEAASKLTRMAESVSTSPQKAVETLILMYLPWAPLPPPQKFDLDFEGGGEGEGGQGQPDVSVVLYLETNSMGKFKVVVQEAEPYQLMVTVFHELAAEVYLSSIEDRLNETMAQDGLPAVVFNTEILGEDGKSGQQVLAERARQAPKEPAQFQADMPVGAGGFKGVTRQDNQQQISIQQGEQVSLLVINTAFAIARLIFDLDQRLRPLQGNR